MKAFTIKDLIDVELPIIQAPMAGVQDSELTIAVCEAGGLGSLPCGMLSIDVMTEQIRAIRKATSRPYNLNFFCHEMPAFNPHQQDIWKQQLQPYYKELGLDIEGVSVGTSRKPFNHEMADAIEPFSPEFISFHFGLPSLDLMQRIWQWGGKIVSSATTVEEAVWLEKNKVDGIIVQGREAGGHRGMFLTDDLASQQSLSVLLPKIVEQVSVPVIAAGGIACHGDFLKVRAMGACAAQVGTTYLLCPESKATHLHKNAIKQKAKDNTKITNVFSGRPARGIFNRAMKVLGEMNPTAPTFPYASIEMTPLRSKAELLGKDDFTPLWCGENTSGCSEQSAFDVTLSLAGLSNNKSP